MFQEALTQYVFGQWALALDLFDEVLYEFPEDKPSKFLKAYIRQHMELNPAENPCPPSYWLGYRQLDV